MRKTRGRKRLLYIYDLCKGKKTCSAGASKTQDENLPPTDQEPDLVKRIVSSDSMQCVYFSLMQHHAMYLFLVPVGDIIVRKV